MPDIDLQQTGPQIKEFLERLLKLGSLELKCQVRIAPAGGEEGAPEVAVELSGPDEYLLLGHGGELMAALEHVVVKFLHLPREEQGRVSLDCGQYKALRAGELRLTAETAAERVARTGAPFALNPMDSRERRIVHLALKDNSSVRTESEGFGPHRKVVILPAGK